MHSNAHACVRMRKNAPDCGITPDLHKRSRADSRPNMDRYGLDGLWACQKACQCSTHVPLHAIQVFIRIDTRVCIHE